MKKFLFIFVILILTMSIGCSKVSGKDTQAIKAPDNNNLKIKGVWSIEDISILDNEIENKEEIMNLKSSLISITNNKFSILNKVYSNPKYKLKVVDETYVLSYELNLKLGDVLEEESKLDLISIIDSNTIV
ncbi:hypothetical protein GNF79_15370, partial [Clostridium perfringens]|nr:hypothetical protein [Clostridium perfringens]